MKRTWNLAQHEEPDGTSEFVAIQKEAEDDHESDPREGNSKHFLLDTSQIKEEAPVVREASPLPLAIKEELESDCEVAEWDEIQVKVEQEIEGHDYEQQLQTAFKVEDFQIISSVTIEPTACEVKHEIGEGSPTSTGTELELEQQSEPRKNRTNRCACSGCGKKYLPRNLFKHAEGNTLDSPVPCSILGCTEQFLMKCALQKHLLIHDEARRCPGCSKLFDAKDVLDYHISTNTYESPVECRRCKARLALRCELGKHLEMHSKEKLFRCSDCEERFSISAVKDHISANSYESPQECPAPECAKRKFSMKCAFNEHLLNHSRNGKIETLALPAAVDHARKLSMAKPPKSRPRPRAPLVSNGKANGLECPACPLVFIDTDGFIKHLINYAETDRCPGCTLHFATNRLLVQHILWSALEQARECPNCDKTCSLQCAFDNHLSIHRKN